MKSNLKKNNNIVFAGCKSTTYECIKSLLDKKHKIDLIISLDPIKGNKYKVAGYFDLSEFANRRDIPIYHCKSYSLNATEDKLFIESINIDLLLVIGWQRLIPEWFLNRLSIGAFGMHGSAQALPFGRGRSPLNWSLIQNKKLFITNLFKYKPGIDDGDILDFQIFDINPFDTAETLHYKNTLSMIKLLEKNLNQIISKEFTLKPQLNITPSYYPKRTSDDGIIFWDRSTEEIYNLIRAVTLPFDGAFTFINSEKIIIWDAKPFDTRLFDPYIFPGTILYKFHNDKFVVKTGDGSLIVNNYEISNKAKIKEGSVLNSDNFVYKNPFLYPL